VVEDSCRQTKNTAQVMFPALELFKNDQSLLNGARKTRFNKIAHDSVIKAKSNG